MAQGLNLHFLTASKACECTVGGAKSPRAEADMYITVHQSSAYISNAQNDWRHLIM